MTTLLMQEPSTLDPCPFCGEEKITLGYDGQPAIHMYFVCLSCGAQGPKFQCGPGGQVAIDIDAGWNNRYRELPDDKPNQ
jgi:Lar family restriction alleviation protein